MGLLMFLLLTSSLAFAAANTPFWPSFVTKMAAPGGRSSDTLQSFAAVAAPSGAQTPQQHDPTSHKQQQAATTQTVLLSAYPAPYSFLNSPVQGQQQRNYLGHTQLIPSFQALNLAGIYQPSYSIPHNYTQEHNISAAESIPVSGFYPAIQGGYFPSVPASWPSVTLSAFQQPSPNGAGRFPATTTYQPTINAGFNSLAPVMFGNVGYYQNQQGVNTKYPAFPLTAYNQDYAQLGLSKYRQNPGQHLKENKEGVNTPAPVTENETSVREPHAKGRYQYSSKYSRPDFEDKERQTKNSPQDLEDSYDSEESSKYSSSSHASNYEDDDDNGDNKNSFDSAENTKRPQFTHPPNDDDDDEESDESSELRSKSCDLFKSSPSKATSSEYSSFSDDHHDFVRPDFEDQFKAFPTNENFRVPNFEAVPSNNEKVSDYYENPVSTNEKRLRMMYTQHSKVTDSYMTPTEDKGTGIPKTLHYYNYRPPKYSTDKPVEYFPKSPFKFTTERPRTQTNSPGYMDRDAVGHHPVTMTATHMSKMYR